MGKPQRNSTEKTFVKSDSNSATPKFNDEPIEPLSGNPFCDFILSNERQLSRMVFPDKINEVLPNGKVPALITYGKKTWKTIVHGDKKKKSLDSETWKKILIVSKLKVGDALILEVMDNSQQLVVFKAQILRGNFPAELKSKIAGGSAQTPISIDD